MKILLLTGPAGAGKNTIGYALAKKRKQCAVIDADVVRWMYFQPHISPWEGKNGIHQQTLSVTNTCQLARNFYDAQADVIILDVVTNQSIRHYASFLKGYAYTTILLFPSFEETQRRLATRQFRIPIEEEKRIYAWQKAFKKYDLKVDTTNVSPATVVQTILPFFASE